jgi:hypothetical protein
MSGEECGDVCFVPLSELSHARQRQSPTRQLVNISYDESSSPRF